ncbi:MAG TPA: DUF2946 family protein [Nevskiaceae bacterium]|nr:DUF2946 family protein [Nevskiaceae bacterium]
MEAWVFKALARWPNVPHLYGWLRLDRRGRWLIRGSIVTRQQIIDTINPNYAADERGCWYFQNGPQRGYVTLDYTPLTLRSTPDGQLYTHTGQRVTQVRDAWLDENSALTLTTEHGPGVVEDNSLDWVLARLLDEHSHPPEADALEAALTRASGQASGLWLHFDETSILLQRCDAADLPARIGFVREPQP